MRILDFHRVRELHKMSEFHWRISLDLEAKVEALGKRGVLIDESLKVSMVQSKPKGNWNKMQDSIGYADVNCQVASGTGESERSQVGMKLIRIGRVVAKATTSGARGYVYVSQITLQSKWLEFISPKQAMIRVDAAQGFVELRGKVILNKEVHYLPRQNSLNIGLAEFFRIKIPKAERPLDPRAWMHAAAEGKG